MNIENLIQTFENLLLQNYSTKFLDITIIKVCSNGGADHINSKLIAKANLNIAIVMQTLKVLFSRTAQQNSMILHTHGPWVCVIKWTHTVYFSSSLYIINQKPMIPRTHFHCITTWVARFSG